MIRLSVIIPGYNTPEEWWRRCLYSVRQACGPDDEIICVDDGSAKHPVFLDQIAAEDPRVKPIFLEKNVGQAAARNKALDAANGEWIAFVDSDDEVEPDVYDRCFGVSDLADSDIVLFGVRVVWADEKLFKDDVPFRRKGNGCLDVEEVVNLFKSCLFEYPVNRIYRKRFLDRHRIRFDFGICPGEDTIFNLKCLLAKARYSIMPFVGYVYYRFFTSSLARYQARFGESLRIRNGLWREVKSMLGAGNDPKWKLGELSGSELAFWDMKNMWRYDSPIQLIDRWRWQKTNSQYFSAPAWIMFFKELLGGFIRRYFYIRAIRRWKIKRMFPNAKEMK